MGKPAVREMPAEQAETVRSRTAQLRLVPLAESGFTAPMPTNDLRYAGFEQAGSKRLFQFDCKPVGRPALRLVVAADLALFPAHRVNVQAGPVISARKLAAVLGAGHSGACELTEEDLRAYAAEQAMEADRKSQSQKRPRNRVRRYTSTWVL